VVFALMLRSEEAARRFGLLAGRAASRLLRLVGRPPVAGWELATVKFRARTVDLVQRRWVAITVTSLVSHLSLYLVLLVALRDVGVSDAEVGWAEVLAVFAFARLATAIPLTPGGVGFVEGVLFAGLVAAGGDRSQVAAAVLVYRALTWALPILVGSPATCGGDGSHGRHHHRTCSARPRPGDRDRQPTPPGQRMTAWNPPHGMCSRVWLARCVLAHTGSGSREADGARRRDAAVLRSSRPEGQPTTRPAPQRDRP
jgi:Lysylphosphatidylglycerol synthase TM region